MNAETVSPLEASERPGRLPSLGKDAVQGPARRTESPVCERPPWAVGMAFLDFLTFVH